MDPLAFSFAVGAGLLVSLLPVLSWGQGAGLDRQLWLILCGHAVALVVLAAVAVGGATTLGGPRFILIGAASGVCSGLNGTIYYTAVIRRGPVAISWVVIWLSAVVVAALGWLIVGEPVYAAQPIALACFVGCLAAMGWATYRANRQRGAVAPVQRGFWGWLAAAMGAGAAGLLLIKARPPGGSDLAFVLCQLAGLVAALAAFVTARRIRLPRDRRTFWMSLGWAGVVGPHFLLVVAGLRRADVSVFSPVLAGTALAAGVAWALIRGERPSRLAYLGAALALVSVVLISLKGPILLGR